MQYNCSHIQKVGVQTEKKGFDQRDNFKMYSTSLRKINGFSGSYHDLWKPGESCGCILFVFIGFLLTEICKEMQVIFVANSLHKQIYTLEKRVLYFKNSKNMGQTCCCRQKA